jgi:hypothetical protein
VTGTTGAGVAVAVTEAERAALAEVLARPEFRPRRFDLGALRELLAGGWARLLELLGTAEAERWASLGRAVFLVALALVGLLAWRTLRRRSLAATRRPPPPPTGLSLGAPAPEAAAIEAARALGAGDLSGAVRLAYRACAACLPLRGPALPTASLTGRELAALSGEAAFASLARLHERTVFGLRSVTAAEARGAVELATRWARREAAP